MGITHRQASRACSIITASSPSSGLHHATRRHSPPPPGAPFSCRQAPLHCQGLCYTIPPGGTLPTARHQASTVATATDLFPSAWRLALAARRHTSSAMLLVFGTLNRSHWILIHTTHQLIEQLGHTKHNSIT